MSAIKLLPDKKEITAKLRLDSAAYSAGAFALAGHCSLLCDFSYLHKITSSIISCLK